MGWGGGVSCRGGVGHVGVGWGWVMQGCGGVGCVMQGCGGSCRDGVGWGGSCRGQSYVLPMTWGVEALGAPFW